MQIPRIHCNIIIEPPHDKTNKMACAPSEDSDQPGHPRRLWSDGADAQADLSLHLAHMPFCWFCHAAAHMYVNTPVTWHLLMVESSHWSRKLPIKCDFGVYDELNLALVLLYCCKKLNVKSRECHNHKPQSTHETKRKRKRQKKKKKGNTCKLNIHMSHDTTKRVFGSFQPGQTQTGLRSHRS